MALQEFDFNAPKSLALQTFSPALPLTAQGDNNAQNEREWLALLPIGVIIINANGVVVDANPVAVDMLGTPLLFQAWRDIIARAFAPKSDDGMEISLRDGRRVKLTTRALANGEGQLIALADLTESRQAQAQAAQRERLAAMGEMIATLVHQLRTPLSSALLFAHQLQQTAAKYSNSSTASIGSKSADQLIERLQFMERQISDLLLVAGGGATLVEQVALLPLLKLLVQEHKERLAAQHIELKLEAENVRARIYGNADALRGAISNLIENAEQACLDDSKPAHVICLRLRRIGACVDVLIEDDGKGMCDAVRMRALEPFFSTKRRGTGLGLAVVNAVVQSHQGQMHISSLAGHGSQFQLRFPLILAQQQKHSSGQTMSATSGNEVAA